jgi:hypothetical protein
MSSSEEAVIGQPEKYKCDYCGSVFWHVEHLDQRIDCPSCGAPNPKIVSQSIIDKAVIGEEEFIEENITTASGVAKGVGILIAAILGVVVLYFTAYTIPSALTAIANASLGGISTSTQNAIQDTFSIVMVGTVVLVFVAVIRTVITTEDAKEEDEVKN